MNVPKEYNTEAKCLSTNPLLLPKEDVPGIMSPTDKGILKKKNNNKTSVAPRVSFAQKTPTRT